MTVCLVKNEKYIRTRVYKERIDKQKLFSMVTARLLLLFKANNIVMANNIAVDQHAPQPRTQARVSHSNNCSDSIAP